MKIAVVGIDGAGKSTFIERVASCLCARGITVACVRVPDFDVLPWGLQTIGKYASTGWRFADSRGSTPLVIFFLLVAVLLFSPALWSARRAEVVLIEHHPRIDLPAFAHLWGGSFCGLLSRILAHIWRPPDVAVMLEVSVEVALERIRKRDVPLQLHETPDDLSRLSGLLRVSVKHAVPECFFWEKPVPEIFAARVCDSLITEEDPC